MAYPITTAAKNPLSGRNHGRARRKGWGRPIRLTLLVAGGALAAITGGAACVAHMMARPRRNYGGDQTPEGSYQEVRFPASDGVALSGWFLPAGEPGRGVVLCHGFHTNRREVLTVAEALRERGHHVLMFDFRAHGESFGTLTTCGSLEVRDLEGAVRYLLSRPELGYETVGVLGYSMGGAVALLTAAEMPEIGVVIADSAFSSLKGVVRSYLRAVFHLPVHHLAPLALWFGERFTGVKADGIRPMEAIGRIAPRAVLLIHGIEDEMVPLTDAYLLYQSAREPKELWTVAEVGHVGARYRDFAAYIDRVDGFLRHEPAPHLDE